MTVKGNVGTINTTHNANVKVYGDLWFDERAITNIFALNYSKRKFRVTYYINNEVLFKLHNPNFQYIYTLT